MTSSGIDCDVIRRTKTEQMRHRDDVYRSPSLSSFMDSLCRARNKIIYVLSWRTFSALIRVLFWCLFPSLLRKGTEISWCFTCTADMTLIGCNNWYWPARNALVAHGYRQQAKPQSLYSKIYIRLHVLLFQCISFTLTFCVYLKKAKNRWNIGNVCF